MALGIVQPVACFCKAYGLGGVVFTALKSVSKKNKEECATEACIACKAKIVTIWPFTSSLSILTKNWSANSYPF
jgi:hypothetical protein